jgi:hypothetical protein
MTDMNLDSPTRDDKPGLVDVDTNGNYEYNEEEDDDEVIDEMDVRINHQLAQTLCLVQFPEKPAHQMLLPTAIRYKESYDQVEMEIALDSANPNYDPLKGRELVKSLKPPGKSGSGMASYDEYLDTLTLSGSRLPKNAQYFIGVKDYSEYFFFVIHSFMNDVFLHVFRQIYIFLPINFA